MALPLKRILRRRFVGAVPVAVSVRFPVAFGLGMLAMLVTTSGCGNAIYGVKANEASNKVEEAHELGAETLAPYEYYYAKEHLEKAEEEAAEASYGDARNLAEASEEYADKAIELSREAHRGAGR
jgi:hypothetical protein